VEQRFSAAVDDRSENRLYWLLKTSETQIPRGLTKTKALDADLKVRSTKQHPSPNFSAACKGALHPPPICGSKNLLPQILRIGLPSGDHGIEVVPPVQKDHDEMAGDKGEKAAHR
jgi:hypothetical protein